MSNVATLTLKGTSDLKAISTDLKSVATSAQQAKTPLDGLNKSMDQGSKTTASFGQKLKGFGSQFSSSISSIGTLGGTVLNLSRQYQDLGDSQIRVDRMQLKVSKTTEATGVAQGKLNALVAKGVTSGAEYDKALLDVKQALEAQGLAERNLQEAQEDHQRAQENFWIGLVPTVTSAGASVISVLNEIGGTKGLGGLKTTLLSFGTKVGGGIAGVLSGIGSSASASIPGLGAMTKGVGGLSLAMKGLALSSLPVALAIGGIVLVMKPAALVIHEIVSLIKGDVVSALDSAKAMLDFFDTIGPIMAAIPGGAAFNVITKLGGFKEELAKVREEAVKTAPAIREIDPALQALDSGAQTVSNTIDAFGGNLLGLIGTTDAAAQSLPQVGTGLDGIGTAATGATGPITGLTGAVTTFVGGNIGLLDALAKTGVAFVEETGAADPLALAIANVGRQADAAKGPLAELTKNAQANATAAQNAARRNQEMASAIAKATQSMQKQAQVARQYPGVNSKPGQGFRNPTGGSTKKSSGPSYTLNGVRYYGSVAPPNRKAASGMHEMVDQPTWSLAGESGKERVDISPSGSGGGGGTTIVNVFLDGNRIDQGMRYRINKGSSVVK